MATQGSKVDWQNTRGEEYHHESRAETFPGFLRSHPHDHDRTREPRSQSDPRDPEPPVPAEPAPVQYSPSSSLRDGVTSASLPATLPVSLHPPGIPLRSISELWWPESQFSDGDCRPRPQYGACACLLPTVPEWVLNGRMGPEVEEGPNRVDRRG